MQYTKRIALQAKVNANMTYKNKVQFMTLGEIRELHRNSGFDGHLKLELSTMVSTLKLMGAWD